MGSEEAYFLENPDYLLTLIQVYRKSSVDCDALNKLARCKIADNRSLDQFGACVTVEIIDRQSERGGEAGYAVLVCLCECAIS